MTLERGNFRRNLFLDDEDREPYLALLTKYTSLAELEAKLDRPASHRS